MELSQRVHGSVSDGQPRLVPRLIAAQTAAVNGTNFQGAGLIIQTKSGV